jgi:hypothetical protein
MIKGTTTAMAEMEVAKMIPNRKQNVLELTSRLPALPNRVLANKSPTEDVVQVSSVL